MFRIIRVIFFLAVLGLLALTAFAFLGDITPEQRPVEVPVTLEPG